MLYRINNIDSSTVSSTRPEQSAHNRSVGSSSLSRYTIFRKENRMEKLSPKAQGNLGEAAALKELLKHDLIVCPPYGDNAPYDYMDITNKMAHY